MSRTPLELRKRRAIKIGFITALIAFGIVLIAVVIAFALGYISDSGDSERRGQLLGRGMVLLSAWCGLIGWCIARYFPGSKPGAADESKS